ncbi:Major capsid protein Gp5 [uncultured Caudovirales phage]|uniref:Major capsid protein Gp5 n=1 Tax=uncultured Caudovirales phage TaxID=2100421 RepID=A0A6J5S1V1_9CAUD|nr:Major capsid protein Gp5 [uncultured Caudovirales phage]
MANFFETNNFIDKVVLTEFENNLHMAKTVNRQFQNTFSPQSGTQVRIRKPTRYVPVSGQDLTAQVQDIQERTVTLNIDTHQNVLVEVTSEQLALELDDFMREILNPAILQLANKIDSDLYQSSLAFYNAVGTAGTAVNSLATMNQARTLLTSQGVSLSPRSACLNPIDGGALSTAQQQYFNYANFNEDVVDNGMVGRMAGFEIYEVQNTAISLLSSASLGAGPYAVNGPVANGATTVNVDGLTPGVTIYAGAIFTIAGVGAVNPITRNPTGFIKQFANYADVVVDGLGNAALTLNPEDAIVFNVIYLNSQYNNVTALPVDGATVLFEASHSVNPAYCPEAFTLAMIKLPEFNNKGAYSRTFSDPKSGISFRVGEQASIVQDKQFIRVDCLYGLRAFQEYGCRIMGSYTA